MEDASVCMDLCSLVTRHSTTDMSDEDSMLPADRMTTSDVTIAMSLSAWYLYGFGSYMK